MKYNVFCDFHHASLLQSFIMLFEKRLGGNVYRPIGVEWFNEGFWKVYDHPATVQQFLGINAATPDGTPPLNDAGVGAEEWREDVFLCNDIDSGGFNKAITLAGFLRKKIDIVIATLPQHIEPFKRLCEIHPNHPKLIYQIGNSWNIPEGIDVKNVMASAKVPTVPEGINFISYHQEFDIQVFKPFSHIITEDNKVIWPEMVISSFVNCFNLQDHFAADWAQFTEVEKMLPDWKFRSYGGQCRDGSLGPAPELSSGMGHSRFVWHTKNGGDGYGHIIHNVAACARPLIVKKEYYAGKMAEDLLIDGLTCVTIDGLSPQQIVDKILHYNEPERYKLLCANAYTNFKRIVNFDEEFTQIKLFLQNLK